LTGRQPTLFGTRRRLRLDPPDKLDRQGRGKAIEQDIAPEARVDRLVPKTAHRFYDPVGAEIHAASKAAIIPRLFEPCQHPVQTAREGAGTRVIVTEHSVRVTYPAAAGRNTVLAEGDAIRYGPEAGLGRIASVNTADAMAWTDGVLVFKDAPLGEVVAAISRYHRGYVRVSEGARNIRVSGVVRIDDPVAALDQLEHSLGVRSTRLTDRLIFIST